MGALPAPGSPALASGGGAGVTLTASVRTRRPTWACALGAWGEGLQGEDGGPRAAGGWEGPSTLGAPCRGDTEAESGFGAPPHSAPLAVGTLRPSRGLGPQTEAGRAPHPARSSRIPTKRSLDQFPNRVSAGFQPELPRQPLASPLPPLEAQMAAG